MSILGLTHDKSGAALEKLPVIIKVAIGEGPEDSAGNRLPQALDHFIFKRRKLQSERVIWTTAPEISAAHGAEEPKQIDVVFLHDDLQEVFRTEYAWWTREGCQCRGQFVQISGNGHTYFEMQAVRKTAAHPEGECWPGEHIYSHGPRKGEHIEPCGEDCPDLGRGECKPSGDLHFLLDKFPVAGGICRLHTSSYRSIRNLSHGLLQIQRINAGRLCGIKATLKVSPEEIYFRDPRGFRQRKVIYVLSLEAKGKDLQSLLAEMNGSSEIFGQRSSETKPVPPVRYVAHETEAERAREIAAEFYPREPAGAGEEPADEKKTGEEEEQLARICEQASHLGLSKAQVSSLLRQWAEDPAGLERKLLNELEEQPGSGRGRSAGGKSGIANPNGATEPRSFTAFE